MAVTIRPNKFLENEIEITNFEVDSGVTFQQQDLEVNLTDSKKKELFYIKSLC